MDASSTREVQAAVAEAFARLWVPEGQPVGEPDPVVRDAITTQVNRLYYHVSARTWKDTFYRGVPVYKCPTDMWVYQELVHDLRPGLVVETGTFRGGSGLFIADRLEENGHGEVVTVDITSRPEQPQHPRLTYLVGSSTSEDVLAEVRRRLPADGSPVLVILDSDHSQAHVADELRAYSPLVTEGSYLIVEDTNVNGHPVAPQHGPGPWEAVHDFLSGTDSFEVDLRAERYYLTQNPSGYLRRTSTGAVDPAPVSTEVSTRRPGTPKEKAAAALAGVATDADAPRVALVLPGVRAGQMFAGIRTAVVAAAAVGRELGRPLRVVVADVEELDGDALAAEIVGILSDEDLADQAAGLSVSVEGRRETDHHAEDVWIATYWTTAVALDGLVGDGRVDRQNVVYLVQDFEPAFHPWGRDFIDARGTYELGFAPLVNSSSLARFLRREGVADVDDRFVFAPTIETAPLRAAADRWQPEPDVLRVLFYARPSKPRNLYSAGVDGLRRWIAAREPGARLVVTLAGETMSVPPFLGDDVEVRNLGKVSFAEYYDELSRTDLGLALMLSPHPSHLALEMPMAGIPTVTNDFLGARSAWVEGLHLADPGPEGIAAALDQAARQALGLSRHRALDVPAELGRPLGEAVAERVRTLGHGA
ncbi:CmcI family methyltransferase [Aeromicrobium halocynthiae]|uniref:CmcI family methyltransferase n=1 Tax=Aeromicrobium halocynthiae TaxID=560557 RepID=UPI0031D41F31